MATTADLLTQAQTAYHNLMTGGQPVQVRDSNGEMVTYTPATASRLRMYIDDLTNQVAGTQQSARGPMRPRFG